MKYFYLFTLLLFFSSLNAQETLQTVTDRGTSTNREIQFVSSTNSNKYVFLGGNGGYARIGAFDPSIGFDKLIIEASKLGLGIINPTEKFDVDGFIKSGNISFGYNTISQTGPKNYLTFGGDGHASLLIGSNMFIENNSELKVAMNHGTLSGAGILIPGNSMINQNSIQFHTNPAGNAVAGSTSSNLRMIVTAGGDVGIGTATPQEKLAVNGKIRAKEIKIDASGWPDYVFEKGYQKMSLKALEEFISLKGHLPEVPSAKQVVANGLELGEMNKVLLKKIEELTLYLIEKEKELVEQAEKIRKQEERLSLVEKALVKLNP